MSRRKRRTGRLRHTVTVQQDSSDEGTLEPTFTTPSWGRGIPCNVADLTAEEATTRSRQAEGIVTTEVTMRHLPGLRVDDRILFRNRARVRTLYVVGIHHDGYGHDMTADCREDAAT